MNSKNIYLSNQINSSTPVGMIVLLYDGLLRFSEEAENHLSQEATDQNKALAANSVTRSIAILTELNLSLRPEHNPELCDRLKNLYLFFMRELTKALSEYKPGRISKIVPLLKTLRNTWAELDQKVVVEAILA